MFSIVVASLRHFVMFQLYLLLLEILVYSVLLYPNPCYSTLFYSIWYSFLGLRSPRPKMQLGNTWVPEPGAPETK